MLLVMLFIGIIGVVLGLYAVAATITNRRQDRRTPSAYPSTRLADVDRDGQSTHHYRIG